jgi:hypothetical protein
VGDRCCPLVPFGQSWSGYWVPGCSDVVRSCPTVSGHEVVSSRPWPLVGVGPLPGEDLQVDQFDSAGGVHPAVDGEAVAVDRSELREPTVRVLIDQRRKVVPVETEPVQDPWQLGPGEALDAGDLGPRQLRSQLVPEPRSRVDVDGFVGHRQRWGSGSAGGVVFGHLGREAGCSAFGVGSSLWGAVGGLSCGPALRPVLGPVALGHGRHQVDASQASIGDLLNPVCCHTQTLPHAPGQRSRNVTPDPPLAWP